MEPKQLNKEILFNEAMIKLDNFIIISIQKIVTDLPQNITTGTYPKYLLSEGTHKNEIAYYSFSFQTWCYLAPKEGMTIFLQATNNYLIYNNQDWQGLSAAPANNTKVAQTLEILTDDYNAIGGEYFIEDIFSDYYLTLINDVKISLNAEFRSPINLFIKQNEQKLYKVTLNIDKKRILNCGSLDYQGPEQLGKIDLLKIIPVPLYGQVIQIIN